MAENTDGRSVSASTEYFDQAFRESSYLAIIRGLDPARTVARCEAAWSAGITAVEVPVQSPDAMPSLLAAVAAARDRGLTVGAGTVVTLEQLETVRKAGVSFTVAPGTNPFVIAASGALPHLPGVATATDITLALSHGLTWLKAFPAAQLGVDWIAAQRGPFPQVAFVATGGIDLDNAQAFLSGGCRVVALGSALDDPAQLARLSGLNRRTALDGYS